MLGNKVNAGILIKYTVMISMGNMTKKQQRMQCNAAEFTETNTLMHNSYITL